VDRALDEAAAELEQLANRLRVEGHADEAEIVGIGALIAQDPVLRSQARDHAERSGHAAQAIIAVSEEHATSIEAIGDATLRERAADVRQVGRRAAALANGKGNTTNGLTGEPLIIVAEELGPADITGLQAGTIAAGVAVKGGPNSHAAIVARSLGIPLVLGIGREILDVADGTPLIVDGENALVTVRPSPHDMDEAVEKMRRAAERREALASERSLPARTIDGTDVALLCNIASPEEATAGLLAGAEGVGLLRTELPFLDSPGWPDEKTHAAMLQPVFDQLEGKLVTVRVLDFGGDKLPPFLASLGADPQGLPHRGLPALLSTPDALSAQLRAILEAGAKCRLRILLPMVTSMREYERARVLLEEAVAEVGAEMPELGVMVEIPSAALLADTLAREVDFFSIGSNDLTQHVLGLNRRDPNARPALAAHPSILTLIGRVVRAGRDHGKPVAVCGEAAADPLVLPLIIGAGVRAVSVSPASLDATRARIRRLSQKDCDNAFRQAVRKQSVVEVWDLVKESNFPDLD
jgi:phosphoenolpyruvate-protein phosphotransferase